MHWALHRVRALHLRLLAQGPRKKDGSGGAVFWASLLAGIAAGGFSSFTVTPIDGRGLLFSICATTNTGYTLIAVVKTRLQLLKRAEGEIAYTGVMDAFT